MSVSEAMGQLKPGQVFCRLEVEADAKYQAGFIVIRCYANENNGGRILLSLASLNNRIIEQRSNAPKRRVWSDADASFLKWMAPKLAQIPYHQQNVNVLKITEHEFETWRNRWVDQRSRFIDRYTQEFILPPGCDSPCRQLVDLLPEDGNRVKIALKIEFSDGSTRYPHEILRTIGLGADSFLHRQLASWKPAVSWAQMNRYFSRKSPSLPHSEVVRLLGELLEGHLELVRSGELARVSASEGGNAAEIRFDALPGKFRVSAKFGGSSIGLGAVDGVDKPRIIEKDGKFFIYSHGEKEESGILRRWLSAELNKLRNVQELPDGSLELRGSQDNAKAIREIWHRLNEQCAGSAVLKRGHDLAPLLDGASQLQPEIMIGEVGTIGIETKLKWQCGEVSLEHQALLQAVATHNELLQDDHGNWLCIDTAYAKEILERIKREGLPEYDVLPKRDAARLLNDWQLKNLMRVADASRRIFQEICQLLPFEIPALPECLSGTLREYQKVACEFLYDRLASNAGCILADDMGLGKTLEVISLMALWKQSHPESSNLGALVICPATLVPHWAAQIHRFAGDVLTCREVIGTPQQRKKALEGSAVDVFITHYGLLKRDQQLLENRDFALVVLDEAQAIKNPLSQTAMSVYRLNARHRIAMTGTPLENRLNDLWSIMHFLNPGLLGELETFEKRYFGEAVGRLVRRIRPFILRRTKEEVATELPPKTIQTVRVTMNEEQRRLYDTVLVESKAGLNKSTHFEILACLTRLRQICCHPALYSKDNGLQDSAKLEFLQDNISTLLSEGHSALIFSQFTAYLDIIAAKLSEMQVPFSMITGETPIDQRARLVDEFNRNAAPGVFLLSLKAGGTGLTLTKADYVFLCDPWWNPAVENQAIDRVHRIGQTRPVFAYRIIADNSVEEKVLALIQAKQKLFDTVIDGASDGEDMSTRLSQQDLLNLIAEA